MVIVLPTCTTLCAVTSAITLVSLFFWLFCCGKYIASDSNGPSKIISGILIPMPFISLCLTFRTVSHVYHAKNKRRCDTLSYDYTPYIARWRLQSSWNRWDGNTHTRAGVPTHTHTHTVAMNVEDEIWQGSWLSTVVKVVSYSTYIFPHLFVVAVLVFDPEVSLVPTHTWGKYLALGGRSETRVFSLIGVSPLAAKSTLILKYTHTTHTHAHHNTHTPQQTLERSRTEAGKSWCKNNKYM